MPWDKVRVDDYAFFVPEELGIKPAVAHCLELIDWVLDLALCGGRGYREGEPTPIGGGAHILESDVHATRDGAPVLAHDASL